MKHYNTFSILLVCKKIAVILLLVFILGACASQRHNLKPPKAKRGCNCPHFMQGYFIDNAEKQVDI